MDKTRVKKISNTVINVLLCIFLALSIFFVFVTVFSNRSADGAAEIFGYQMRVVTSDSMAKSEFTDTDKYDVGAIAVRSLVFVDTVPDGKQEAYEWYSDLEAGDVLTFRYVYTRQVTITHRIKHIEEKNGGFLIELTGDNKNSEDGQLTQTIDTSLTNSPNYVIGKVTGQSYLLGLVLSLLTEPIGMILVIILPCSAIIIAEVVKITKVLSVEKRRATKDEMDRQKDEIEELRRKLAELEEQKNTEREDEK